MAALPLEQVALSHFGRPDDPAATAIDTRSVPPAAAPIALIVAVFGCFLSPPLANIAVVAAAVLALASPPVRARLGAVVRQPLGRGALVFLGIMTAAMLWAGVPWPERLAAWWNWRTMLLIVLTAAAFGDVRWKERFCLAVVAATALGALISFGMWAVGISVEPNFSGTLMRNHVTQSMALAVGVLLGATMACERHRAPRARAWLAVAALICLANLATITEGRSGQVAVLVATVSGALLTLDGRRRWQAIVLVLVAATALVAVSPRLQQRFARVAYEAPSLDCAADENSTGLRLLLWHTTADLIAARPWFGYGVGGFTRAYESAVSAELRGQPKVGWCARPAHDPHDQFLRVTAEAGLLGLLAFGALLLGAVRQRSTGPYRAYGLALLAAWCATSLFNSHFQTFNEGHLIALLMGALLAPDGSGAPAYSASASNTALRTSS